MVALLMFNATLLEVVVVVVDEEEDDEEDVVLVTLATYTWFGVETVSEKTAMPPFCETPMTLPVMTPNCVRGIVKAVNALLLVPMLAGLSVSAPYWLPIYAPVHRPGQTSKSWAGLEWAWRNREYW